MGSGVSAAEDIICRAKGKEEEGRMQLSISPHLQGGHEEGKEEEGGLKGKKEESAARASCYLFFLPSLTDRLISPPRFLGRENGKMRGAAF